MAHRYYRPHAGLDGYVRTVIFIDDNAPDPEELPLFTRGIPALLCKVNCEKNAELVQLALHLKSLQEEELTAKKHERIFVLLFEPFSISTIFNLDVSARGEASVDLRMENEQRVNALRAGISCGATPEDQISVLNSFVLGFLEENRRNCEIIKFATDYFMLHPETESLSEVLKRLAMNERSFQRVFKKYVGITAMKYRRICQFQTAFSQVRAKDFDKLADVAFDNGFADQSHFIRSFKEFTNLNPNQYLDSGLKPKK